jgi:hypothetical protein
MTKLPVRELLRLACIYAERDQRELLRCLGDTDPEQSREPAEFIKQIHKYREVIHFSGQCRVLFLDGLLGFEFCRVT